MRVKVEIDDELWYGTSSDEAAEAQASQSMAARMGRIVGAKPFPAAAQRLSQITEDPNCQMDDVVAVLESDPALAARLLRLVNSVGYSLRTACTSVRHAAALVGTEKLNQVASTAAILDMYESGGERAKELLEHATVVGALCRYLAFHFGLPPDELFTCGFLHDIGKLMLLDTEGAEYLELLGSELADFDTTFVEERKRYGFDHALLGGHVLAAWNIPHPVPKVVAWHHHVTRAYAESTEISQMVSTLRLADAMSFALMKPDTEVQIETLARMEAASYMDISEGQLAAMWEEVRGLAERARAVFRGEKVEDAQLMHTSRPSGASLRAVARAKNQERFSSSGLSTPPSSERTRQFPCVACGAPSYAQRCSACHGYMCPLHIAGEDEWCRLCQSEYEEAGIPSIRPIVSTLFGALAGALVAAAFFGAASASAQRPLRIMIGPTLILMLLGMLAGVGQRWIRRWWFLRSRPSRASIVPKAVETLLDSAALQDPQILEVEAPEQTTRGADFEPSARDESDPTIAAEAEQLSLLNPEFPAPPAMPQMEEPTLSSPPLGAPPGGAHPRSTNPRGSLLRERTWMSSRTPHPSVVAERIGAMSPPGVTLASESEPLALEPGAPESEAPELETHESEAPELEAPESEAPELETPEPLLAQAREAEPTSTAEVPSKSERASEPLPISEERAVSDDILDELQAAQSAVGGARRRSRASGSVRPPPSDSSRPFAGRSERPSNRPNRPEMARLSERAPNRLRPSSAPPSSQRARTAAPVVTSMRPIPANSANSANEPPMVRQGSVRPPAIDAPSETLLDLPPEEPRPMPVASRPPPAERPAIVSPPSPFRRALDAAPAPAPAENVPQNDSAPSAAAWLEVLDAQGTAGGW
jgi:HD-like signal output (HDOD) protein